jgi:hypothetical protein
MLKSEEKKIHAKKLHKGSRIRLNYRYISMRGVCWSHRSLTNLDNMRTLTDGLVIGNMSIVYSIWLLIITYVDSPSSMTNGQMDELKAEITSLRTVNDHVDNEKGLIGSVQMGPLK